MIRALVAWDGNESEIGKVAVSVGCMVAALGRPMAGPFSGIIITHDCLSSSRI